MSSASWIYDPNGKGYMKGGWRCPKCTMVNNNIGGHGKIDPHTFIGSSYCPHCGLRMDGKTPEHPPLKTGGVTMEKINTVQKADLINEVYRIGEQQQDGAYDTYAIVKIEHEENENPIIATVKFQKGPRSAKTSRHGILDHELIEIVKDRLELIQKGKYASEENRIALFLLEEALKWLGKRGIHALAKK